MVTALEETKRQEGRFCAELPRLVLVGKDVERVEIAMADRCLSCLRRSMIVQPGQAGFQSDEIAPLDCILARPATLSCSNREQTQSVKICT